MIDKTVTNTVANPQIQKQNQGEQIISERQQGKMESSETLNVKNDEVSLSYKSESLITYDSTMSLNNVKNDGFDLLRAYVLNIFKEQGLSLNIPTGDSEINLETISQEEAAELVADDGYFGVEKTSDRIVDFAIGVAGGDPSRIDAIKAGVEKGFQEAREAFGGELPEISYQTYDAVIEKLDIWVEENQK
jgi:hypothetical protein